MNLLTASSEMYLVSCLMGRLLKTLRRFFRCIRGQRDRHAIRSIQNHDASLCAGQTRPCWALLRLVQKVSFALPRKCRR